MNKQQLYTFGGALLASIALSGMAHATSLFADRGHAPIVMEMQSIDSGHIVAPKPDDNLAGGHVAAKPLDSDILDGRIFTISNRGDPLMAFRFAILDNPPAPNAEYLPVLIRNDRPAQHNITIHAPAGHIRL